MKVGPKSSLRPFCTELFNFKISHLNLQHGFHIAKRLKSILNF